MQAYEDSGCRIILGEGLTDITEQRKLPLYSTEEAIRRIEHIIKTYDHRLNDRVRAWAMPFSAFNCTPDLLKAAKRLVDQYDTGMTLHHTIRPKIREACLQQYGKHPTEFLESIGVLGPNVLLAHVMGLNDAEIESLARTRTNVVMCPSNVINKPEASRKMGRCLKCWRRGLR